MLIPRPETELLVEQAILAAKGLDHPYIIDVGCGSGVIAISLALALPHARVLAIDLSRPALKVAQRNAARHGAPVEFLQANLLQPLTGPFNLICANLPYIPTNTLNQLDVVRHEPRLALDGGITGLSLIHRLLVQAQQKLIPNGTMLLEFEASLGKEVKNIAEKAFPSAEIHLLKDLAGKDRLVKIQTD